MLSEVDLKATISNALDTFWPDFDKSISKLSLRLTISIAFAILTHYSVPHRSFDNALKYSTSQTLLIKMVLQETIILLSFRTKDTEFLKNSRSPYSSLFNEENTPKILIQRAVV